MFHFAICEGTGMSVQPDRAETGATASVVCTHESSVHTKAGCVSFVTPLQAYMM